MCVCVFFVFSLVASKTHARFFDEKDEKNEEEKKKRKKYTDRQTHLDFVATTHTHTPTLSLFLSLSLSLSLSHAQKFSHGEEEETF